MVSNSLTLIMFICITLVNLGHSTPVRFSQYLTKSFITMNTYNYFITHLSSPPTHLLWQSSWYLWTIWIQRKTEMQSKLSVMELSVCLTKMESVLPG